jgi:hypothetical protein
MATKKISLNELRSIVKQIIKEENKNPIQLTPLYTKRDKRGYRFYSANNGTVLYAEKDGVVYNVNDDLKPTGRASIAWEEDSEKFTGLVSDKDIEGKPDGYYEKQTIDRVRNNFKM